jgi:hypothetical protein
VHATPVPKPPSRSEVKNAEARAKLVPLREGERPGAVTAAAFVTALLVVMNVAAAIFGYDAPGSDNVAPLLVYAALLSVMTWGLWHAKYWAVLGLQALLAITMLIAGLSAPLAKDAYSAVVAGAIFIGAGVLFWFLIKAMARIQMPDRH